MGRHSKVAGLLSSGKEKGGRLTASFSQQVLGARREVKEVATSMWKQALRTLALVGIYFLTSIGLTFYQSSLLKKIHFPMTIVTIHFLIKLLLSWGSRVTYSLYTGLPRVLLGWSSLIGRVGLVALVASLDIGLSQWSFQYIQVALYTVTKSTSIIFILFFAILLGLERKHWSLIFIVSMISAGLIMFTYKSTDFSIIGFSMVLSASFLSGIRWTFSQLIMQKSNLGLSNPIDMIFHIQPIMIITLLPFIIIFEGHRLFDLLKNTDDNSLSSFSLDMVEIIAGGVLAFLMETAEFLLLSHTSSLTLSISGILKEIITMGLAVVYQSTDLSVINLVGLVVCLLGISIHVLRKAHETERTKKVTQYTSSYTAVSGDMNIPLLSESDDSEEELYRGGKALGKNRSRSLSDAMLRDNREWTSVRDAHVRLSEVNDIRVKMAEFNKAITTTSPQQQQYSLNYTDSSPARGQEEDMDALKEADKLLEQLDLLSSD